VPQSLLAVLVAFFLVCISTHNPANTFTDKFKGVLQSFLLFLRGRVVGIIGKFYDIVPALFWSGQWIEKNQAEAYTGSLFLAAYTSDGLGRFLTPLG
jgi:hypothetical protein